MEPSSKHTLVAIKAVMQAGKLLKEGYNSSFSISKKEGVHNLVTEYDLKSEKAIISIIEQEFPEHEILSEECGEVEGKKSSYQWIIDPLDGTVNFAHGIPMFGISIGLAKDKEIISGVIYHPITEELFIAEKDKGAYLNGIEISVSKTDQLKNAFLATGFPYNLVDNPNNCIEYLAKILKLGIPIRRIGVACLDLAYLAAGRFDGFWEVSLKPWDCAAGKLLLEEAGGKISHWNGDPFDLYASNPIMATNIHLHKQLYNLLNDDRWKKNSG